MNFNKIPHPNGFSYLKAWRPGRVNAMGKSRVALVVEALAGDIYRITPRSTLWPKNHSQAGLTPPRARATGQGETTTLTVDGGFGLHLRDAKGKTLLASPSGATFGVCGQASLFTFYAGAEDQYYGMGEKWLGLELSNQRRKFWNTDAFGDFHPWVCRNAAPDPLYVAIPYLIVKRGNTYVGLLLDNPQATFVSTAKEPSRAPKDKGAPCFLLGAEDGQATLYVMTGPSLAALTCKLQNLVGKTPLPPVWALGYHQCRWGYQSEADLERLDSNFRKHQIPADGLWLDIDYMDGFRVFTFDGQKFPNPQKTLASLRARGRRVVPIIDPGVKQDKGYGVYDSGRRAGIFCQNPEGNEYVGQVWPGETVFPDFSTPAGRAWWAKQVQAFAEAGIYGAWLDMNDPATGWSALEPMRFDQGKKAHDTFHNQYALGMAMGAREGFLAAHPNERPFLLCRSGSLGSSRYTAIWTGDNTSNYHHLKTGIACTLNLALSGVPFNAMDIGGFDSDTNAQLLQDWMKACFLFPVCRNHTGIGTRAQEPWAFGPKAMKNLRHYIRLRYRFRPYLYNLFIRHAETGATILRPLFHDFEDTTAQPLGTIDDQFLVGGAVMQAPFLLEGQKRRKVVLPGRGRWYAAHAGRWVQGGRTVSEAAAATTTPFYLREGEILPLAPEAGGSSAWDGAKIEFHVLLAKMSRLPASTEYVWDDGLSYDFMQGKRSRLRVRATVHRGRLALETQALAHGVGAAEASFVLYDRFASVTLDGKPVGVKPVWVELAGKKQTLWKVQ